MTCLWKRTRFECALLHDVSTKRRSVNFHRLRDATHTDSFSLEEQEKFHLSLVHSCADCISIKDDMEDVSVSDVTLK